MAAAIESEKTGGKYGHMYVILTEEEYRQPGNKHYNGHGRHATKTELPEDLLGTGPWNSKTRQRWR